MGEGNEFKAKHLMDLYYLENFPNTEKGM